MSGFRAGPPPWETCRFCSRRVENYGAGICNACNDHIEGRDTEDRRVMQADFERGVYERADAEDRCDS